MASLFFLGVYLFCLLTKSPFPLSSLNAALVLLFTLLWIKFYSPPDRKGCNRYGYMYLLPSFLCAVLTVTAVIYVGYAKSIRYNNEFYYLVGELIGLFLLPMTFLLYYRMILAFHCIFHNLPSIPDKAVSDNDLPPCSIVLSTRNEPFEVCRMTLDSISALQYPEGRKEVVVVDNSDREFEDYARWKAYVETQAERYPDTTFRFVHRDGTEGFKPRNLDIAMSRISHDYVLFVDADSTLQPDTLLRAMPVLHRDRKLGFVTLMLQSTNYQANFFARIGSIFQNMIRYLNDFTGRFGYCNFQGHNAIWRRRALEAVGPWQENHRGEVMVTEDVAAAFRCHAAGYYSRSVYIDSGEWVPTSLKEFESMWVRWSYGGMQVFSKYMLDICKSRKIGLKVKLDMLYLIFKMAASLFPVLALMCVFYPQHNPLLIVVMMLTLLPSVVFMIAYYRRVGLGYRRFTPKVLRDLYLAFFVLSSFVSWCCIKAEINYYMHKKQGWKPTGKKPEQNPDAWAAVLRRNYGKLSVSILGLVFYVDSLITYFGTESFWLYFLYMVPSAMFFTNTILSVLIFARSGHQANLSTLAAPAAGPE